MINARRHTLFGAGHGIGRPGQANSERAAATKAQAQTDKLRGAGVVRHSLVNARSSRAPQSHARVAG